MTQRTFVDEKVESAHEKQDEKAVKMGKIAYKKKGLVLALYNASVFRVGFIIQSTHNAKL